MPETDDRLAALTKWQRDLLSLDADELSLDQVVSNLLGVKSVNLRTETDAAGEPTSDDRRWRVQYFGGTYGGTLGECLAAVAALPPCDHEAELERLREYADLPAPCQWKLNRGGDRCKEPGYTVRRVWPGLGGLQAVCPEHAALAAPTPQDPDTGVVAPEPC